MVVSVEWFLQYRPNDLDIKVNEDTRRPFCKAKLLARVFGINMLKCECGGTFSPKGRLKELAEIQRYLKHVGLAPSAPA